MINYEQELYVQKVNSFQSLKSNVIRTLCMHPNLLYGMTVLNAKKIQTKIEEFDASYVAPSLANQSEWVSVVETFWNDITSLVNSLLDTQNSSTSILNSPDAAYLKSLDTSLDIPTRLALLDGTEKVSLTANHGGKFQIELAAAPYSFNNTYVTVNNTYIDLHSIARISSTRIPDAQEISEPLYVELLSDGNTVTVEIENPLQPYVYTTLTNKRVFYLLINRSTAELRLTRNDKFHAFRVKPNSTSIKFGFTGQYTPSSSPIYTSASELAAILGGTVRRTTEDRKISILDGVLDVPVSRCTAFLLDRNNEQLLLDRLTAKHYVSTSLSYEGNARLVYERVVLNSERGMIYSISDDLLSSDMSNNVSTDLISIVSAGDILVDKNGVSAEVLSADGILVLDKKIKPSTCTLKLGAFECWKKLTDGLTIPSIEFPKHTDSTTIANVRYISSVIKNFTANVKSRIKNNQLSRRCLMSILNPLNDVQRQHLALRANRASDILFSGDIQSYIELGDAEYNYELMLKSVIDETRARL